MGVRILCGRMGVAAGLARGEVGGARGRHTLEACVMELRRCKSKVPEMSGKVMRCQEERVLGGRGPGRQGCQE